MKLPKLYAPVYLEFWGLRPKLGANMGVIFDCDEKVIRKCRRVACEEGWKWQICDFHDLLSWDGHWGNVANDIQCLDFAEMDTSEMKIVSKVEFLKQERRIHGYAEAA